MAVIGNPVQDLAWYCFIDRTFAEGLGMPRLEGLPSYDGQRGALAAGHRATRPMTSSTTRSSPACATA